MAAGDEYYEDLLKIVLSYSGEHNTAENVFYASCLGAHGATLTDLNDLAGSVITDWASDVMPLVGSTIALIQATVSDWTDADGLTGIATGDHVGGLTGDPLTDQVATLINEETLMRYRGGRGRIYIPQPDVTKILTGTTWTTAFVSDMSDAVTAFFNSLNVLSIGDDLLTAVLYHRAGNKVVEQGFEDIVEVTCSPTPGTQRRRVRRVGHLR
jgi:hypothetical protein